MTCPARPADPPEPQRVGTGTRRRRFLLFYQGLCRSGVGLPHRPPKCTTAWCASGLSAGTESRPPPQPGLTYPRNVCLRQSPAPSGDLVVHRMPITTQFLSDLNRPSAPVSRPGCSETAPALAKPTNRTEPTKTATSTSLNPTRRRDHAQTIRVGTEAYTNRRTPTRHRHTPIRHPRTICDLLLRPAPYTPSTSHRNPLHKPSERSLIVNIAVWCSCYYYSWRVRRTLSRRPDRESRGDPFADVRECFGGHHGRLRDGGGSIGVCWRLWTGRWVVRISGWVSCRCVSGWVRGSRRGRLGVVGVVSAVVVSVVLAVGVGAQGAGDCYVGLVVQPGGSCTYPGTDVEFRVDDSGSGRLLFFSSGQRLELRATSINGVEYTFVASRQSGGGWLIEEVGAGSATTGPTTTPTTGPSAPDVDASGAFSDVEGSTHEEAIGALAADGVFAGTECAPAMFCPTDPVQRWVMAVWLVRLLDGADPPPVNSTRFADVDGSLWWTPYVERLADLGVTGGCATSPARFCPTKTVTRAQMASFLVRAFGLPSAPSAGFADVSGGVHAANIDALAASGITSGCRTQPLRYCPTRDTTRAQMATFLTRAENRASTSDDKHSRPLAPADPAAFDTLAVGGRLTAADSGFFVDFTSNGRMVESDRFPGTYRYSSIGPNSGTLTLTYDGGVYGGTCTISLTFDSATTGTLEYTCASGIQGRGNWQIEVANSISAGGEAPTTEDKAVTGEISECSGSRIHAGSSFVSITVAGTVTAHRSVSSVKVEAKVGIDSYFPGLSDPLWGQYITSERVGSETIGSMKAGEVRNFSIKGSLIDPSGKCWIQVTWDNIS